MLFRSLGATSVAAGGALTIRGAGFTPATDARVELQSTPVTLASIMTDSRGELSATVTIPADTAPGRHTIVVEDARGTSASAIITIGTAVLPATGSATVGSWMIAAASALLLTGVALLIITRRRRHQA